jgi:hypothetical protein
MDPMAGPTGATKRPTGYMRRFDNAFPNQSFRAVAAIVSRALGASMTMPPR